MTEKFILEDLLNALIELETEGAQLYSELSEKVENQKVADLFSLLAKQEVKHKELYQSYKLKLIPRESVDEDYLSYIKVMLAKNVKFLNTAAAPENLEASVCQSVQLEKDTILFLLEMKKIIEDHHQDEIDQIIDEERKHLRYLYELEY